MFYLSPSQSPKFGLFFFLLEKLPVFISLLSLRSASPFFFEWIEISHIFFRQKKCFDERREPFLYLKCD